MRITLGKLSALKITRALRGGSIGMGFPRGRCSLLAPDPSPAQRFTKHTIDLSALGEYGRFSPEQPLDVSVGCPKDRVRTRGVKSTVHTADLPEGSFVPLGNGIAISSPELLFVELGRVLDPPQHVLLGMELCGTFTRDALSPREGPVAYGISPVTSTQRIERFCKEANGLWGAGRALDMLAYVRDNAWSPMEAVVATMLLLPLNEMGYAFEDLTLNPRTFTPEELLGTTSHASRVPDILLPDTNAGLNYDGELHLDLDSIADAASKEAAANEVWNEENAGESTRSVEDAKRAVREKAIDDLRRNRELAAQGLTVLPVTKEDLYGQQGLDHVVRQLVSVAERAGMDCGLQRRLLGSPALTNARQKVIWSLLPGPRGRTYGRLLAEKRRRVFVPVVYDTELRLSPVSEPDDASGSSSGGPSED